MFDIHFDTQHLDPMDDLKLIKQFIHSFKNDLITHIKILRSEVDIIKSTDIFSHKNRFDHLQNQITQMRTEQGQILNKLTDVKNGVFVDHRCDNLQNQINQMRIEYCQLKDKNNELNKKIEEMSVMIKNITASYILVKKEKISI